MVGTEVHRYSGGKSLMESGIGKLLVSDSNFCNFIIFRSLEGWRMLCLTLEVKRKPT